MGLESVNYSYEVRRGRERDAKNILTRLGAVPRGDEPIYWIIRGGDHWIDLQFDIPPGTIEFRVALSNPPAALEVLRRVFDGLLKGAGGRILDLQRAKYFRRVSPGTWRRLVSAYESKKKTGYMPFFGDFVAAVSADVLFEVAEQQGRVKVVRRGSSRMTEAEP